MDGSELIQMLVTVVRCRLGGELASGSLAIVKAGELLQ